MRSALRVPGRQPAAWGLAALLLVAFGCSGSDSITPNEDGPRSGEACNGLDDDADGATDEGWSCVLGASEECATSCGTAGRRSCVERCVWSTCAPPPESCNGVDDDCDGTTDLGFACRPGSSRSCRSECGPKGTQVCGADCGWQACDAPAVSCDRSCERTLGRCAEDCVLDRDGDGLIDPGALAIGPVVALGVATQATNPFPVPRPLVLQNGHRILQPYVEYVPDLEIWGVRVIEYDGEGRRTGHTVLLADEENDIAGYEPEVHWIEQYLVVAVPAGEGSHWGLVWVLDQQLHPLWGPQMLPAFLPYPCGTRLCFHDTPFDATDMVRLDVEQGSYERANIPLPEGSEYQLVVADPSNERLVGAFSTCPRGASVGPCKIKAFWRGFDGYGVQDIPIASSENGKYASISTILKANPLVVSVIEAEYPKGVLGDDLRDTILLFLGDSLEVVSQIRIGSTLRDTVWDYGCMGYIGEHIVLMYKHGDPLDQNARMDYFSEVGNGTISPFLSEFPGATRHFGNLYTSSTRGCDTTDDNSVTFSDNDLVASVIQPWICRSR